MEERRTAATGATGATGAIRTTGARGSDWATGAGTVVRAVLPRPGLWAAGIGAMFRLARRGWWHRTPFLPIPGEAYWHFRLVTALGGAGPADRLSPEDVVAYLRWCQRSRPRRG